MEVQSTITLTPKGVRWFETRHPWIYSSDIAGRRPNDAGIVTVHDPHGRFLAEALYSPKSKIALRVLTRRHEKIDRDWWKGRLAMAIGLRDRLRIDSNARRLVFAEADGLPSFIVDQYADVLVVQCLSAGMETVKPLLIDLLHEILTPRGIIERSDAPVRKLEGLSEINEVLRGDVPDVVEIQEGDLMFGVDVRRGQKTGAFLDQRDNRFFAGRLASGKTLDVFSYHGWFACHMAKRAESVVCVESSEMAANWIRENAARNGFAKKITVIEANAFDWLRSEAKERACHYDVVNVDPPPFIRHAREQEGGRRGYKEVNVRCVKLTASGGLLMSSSCSQAMGEGDFLEILDEAACDSGRGLQILFRGLQPPDHPILSGFPESAYLQCVVGCVSDIP